jgi:copper chaperone CopZ
MRTVTLHIDGMSCGHCIGAVNQALARLPGATIRSVRIGRAEVDVADDGPRGDSLVTAVEDAGYSVTLVEGDG